MKDYLSRIDTDTPGIRNDVTPLFADHDCLKQLADDLAQPFADSRIDYVACIDALGFILGTAVAMRLMTAILTVRKGGKLPVEVEQAGFSDYSGESKRLEIRKGVLKLGDRVLIVDEWIETGAQVTAAIKLIESQGAEVAGIATINMDVKEQTELIRSKYRVHSVWEDSQEG